MRRIDRRTLGRSRARALLVVTALSLSMSRGSSRIGWYGGAAIVAHGPVGLRAGVTVHNPFFAMRSPIWLAEVGVMSVPLPRRAH